MARKKTHATDEIKVQIVQGGDDTIELLRVCVGLLRTRRAEWTMSQQEIWDKINGAMSEIEYNAWIEHLLKAWPSIEKNAKKRHRTNTPRRVKRKTNG